MSKPAKFITILYDILEQEAFKQCICWTKDGKSIQILRISEFQQKIMEEYFNAKNFQSFLRQLALYGFKMKKNEKNQKVYSHPSFQKGLQYQELQKVQRKKKSANENEPNSTQNKSFQALIDQSKFELEELKKQQERLLQQIRIQFQIQFLISKKINSIVDVKKKYNQHFNNAHQHREMYENPMFLMFKLLFGYKPEHAMPLIEPLLLECIEQLSPFSDRSFSPFILPKFI